MDSSSLSIQNQSSLSIAGLQLDSDDEDEPVRGRKSFFEEGSLNDSSRSQLYDDAPYSPYHQVRLDFSFSCDSSPAICAISQITE
jgi:hypothetical protein